MDVRSFALRCRWQLRALGRNPLIRASDRFEAFAVVAVFVLALLAVPGAAQVEDQIYGAQLRAADEQAHSRHSVEAVVVEGTTGMPADFAGPLYARVEWREGARLRSERIVSADTLEAGAATTLWLDRTGKVVTAPLTPWDAKVTAVGTASAIWVAAVTASLLAAFALRRGLDRYRARAWERELRLLAHNDDGWANRLT